MFERVIHTMKTDMVIHTKKPEMMRLMVEIEYVGKIADVFHKDIPLLVVIALASPFGFGIVLLGKELEVIHISVVCCGVGFEFSLRNRVLLWKSLKIRVLRWTADEIQADVSD
nr:hypothetical protein [Tanacetum cinerariifolium]